jgi:hypothetical protein
VRVTAKFVLYIREHPGGRVVVTPVDFPNLSVDGDSFESARAGVAGRLARQLRTMSGKARAALAGVRLCEMKNPFAPKYLFACHEKERSCQDETFESGPRIQFVQLRMQVRNLGLGCFIGM